MNIVSKICLLVVCVWGLYGCERGQSPLSLDKKPISRALPIITAKSLHSPVGKPSMNVAIKYSEYTVPMGEVFELETPLLSGLDAGELEVTATADNAVTLYDGVFKRFSPVRRGELPFTLNVLVQQPGKHYLTLELTHRKERVKFPHKTVKLILWVGEKPELTLKKASSLSKHTVLPAQERE
ncbi:LPS export ABC transporter periplasmic protein LptC [Gilvimarinus agarilyticus]|uniref:LPS export ABC transporter periplasmic protein LptC n=1 Tax=unclassified Gilvimarinus TaxID=2642066 RepID=UPI001C0A4683|nr:MULTISPECIES: LPS export ABC transporter periplasmic protein LptC [unclassified Gilvimarinus]MBU2887024.1 LPS export ABC transporter periplasmic protein LptC [Gilvimarinus agarilyticus]MDO6571684.1 LPS export ABC transporter periplasmic protein LptC [Gilvimarinus sp. 2_MG-2023]MDO6745756.1 LPS export ABC transporter periplasmic protein LptC [Gilvimarinus sp. 1_MG-2023]